MKSNYYRITQIFLLFILGFFLTVPASGQSSWLSPEYILLIQDKINAYSMYPQEAISRGWEGIAKVKFTLTPDGRIKDIDIAESSGYPLLDAAAILAVKDASPYPFPKNYQGKNEIEVILPIQYLKPQAQTGQPPAEEPGPEPIISGLPHPETITLAPPSKEGLTAQSHELISFLDLALKNNQPTKLALEEVELAQLKLTEAKRNFFPALKLQGYNTTGQVYKVDYEERESKLSLDQPLFAGGRLTDTLRQAKTNLEITQKNYDRLKLDVIQKTETAYYNFIALKMHYQQQGELLKETKEIFDKIQNLSTAGMVIPLELSSATAWLQQMKFQTDSIKQDLFMAELTLKQVLNVKEIPFGKDASHFLYLFLTISNIPFQLSYFIRAYLRSSYSDSSRLNDFP